MSASPDPVAEPEAYRRHLLGLLGDDDPAAVQAHTPLALRAVARDSGANLRIRPEPKEWSVLEVAGHLLDAEIVYAGRYRWILAHDEPPLPGYDQDLWVDGLAHNEDDPDELLRLFEDLRRANLELWRRMPEHRGRVGIHAERGPESLDLSFRIIAGHDRFHLRQAREALERVSSSDG
jgi:hypothetical protein